MDFKALMTKLEQIDKKEILNESVVQPKKVVKNHINENIDLKSSIARALMQEFGVNEAEEDEGTGDDARPETGDEPGGTQQSAPQAQDDASGVDAAVAAQAAPQAQDDASGVDAAVAAQQPQAAIQPAAGSQSDDAFQQANQEPAQGDPAQGGDAIGQAQAATQPTAQPTAQTQPAAPAAQPAAAQPAAQAAPAKPAAPAAGGWQALYAANKAVIGPNPNMIKPGQVLTMPDSKKYTVAPGDTLSAIAAGKFKGKPPAQEQQDESLNLIRKLAGL